MKTSSAKDLRGREDIGDDLFEKAGTLVARKFDAVELLELLAEIYFKRSDHGCPDDRYLSSPSLAMKSCSIWFSVVVTCRH